MYQVLVEIKFQCYAFGKINLKKTVHDALEENVRGIFWS